MNISRIYIENFQKHSVLDLNIKDFNVIIGKSRTGKTAIFRALRFLFYGEWDKTYPNDENKDTIVEIVLDNGLSIKRIKNDKTRKNEAIIKDNKEEFKLESFGDIIPGIERFLDISPIDIGKKINLNFSNQDDKIFIINETKGIKAKWLGRLYGANIINNTLNLMNKHKKQILSEISEEENNIKKLEKELEKYNNIDKIEKMLLILKDKNETLNKLIQIRNKISEYNNNLNEIKKNKRIIEFDVKKAEKKLKIYSLLIRLKNINEKINLIKKNINLIEGNNISINIEKFKKYILILKSNNRLKQIDKEIEEKKSIINITISTLKNKKTILFDEILNGKCPLCDSEIKSINRDKVINNIGKLKI